MTSADASCDESPVFFDAGAESLFGVWTVPAGDSSGVAVTMIPGAGFLSSSHRNRMYVRLARAIAANGHSVLRFDYHGVGESTGRVDGFALDKPFTEDMEAAVAWVDSQGADGHVLVGSCFGARTVLATAPRVAKLRAVVLVSPPVRDFERGEENAVEWNGARLLRRLRDPNVFRDLLDADRRRVYARFMKTKAAALTHRLRGRSPNTDTDIAATRGFTEPLRVLVDRGIPLLFVFGTADGLWHHFDHACRSELANTVQKAGSSFTVELFEGNLHNFDNLDAQHAVVEIVPRWIERALGVTV